MIKIVPPVVVYFTRDSEGVGILGFVEGEETLVRDHSIETAATLINSVDNQRVPDPITGESKTVAQAIIDGDLTGPPLDDAIIICSVLVTNDPNAINPRGAIVSLFEADLIDVRPFVHKVVSTSTIETAVEAAAAGITIKNSQVDTEGKVGVVANNVVSSTTVTLSSPINLFDPAELGYNPVVRFTNVATAADPSGSTSFQTATVTSVLGSDLILATPVTVNAGDLVLRGTFTLDRLTFDLVEELSEVMQRNGSSGAVELTGDTSGTANNTNNVSTKTASQVVDTVDGYNTFAPDIIANTAARHTHSNKALLDTYTQTNADIADAIAKEHTHSNKALLDTYTQTNADIASNSKELGTLAAGIYTYSVIAKDDEGNTIAGSGSGSFEIIKAWTLTDYYTLDESNQNRSVEFDEHMSNGALFTSSCGEAYFFDEGVIYLPNAGDYQGYTYAVWDNYGCSKP